MFSTKFKIIKDFARIVNKMLATNDLTGYSHILCQKRCILEIVVTNVNYIEVSTQRDKTGRKTRGFKANRANVLRLYSLEWHSKIIK